MVDVNEEFDHNLVIVNQSILKSIIVAYSPTFLLELMVCIPCFSGIAIDSNWIFTMIGYIWFIVHTYVFLWLLHAGRLLTPTLHTKRRQQA